MFSLSDLVSPRERGAYILVLMMNQPATINVGRLGALSFAEGFCAYVGSALGRHGTGTLARLKHHLSLAGRQRWHIDYLIMDERVKLVLLAYASTSVRYECQLCRNVVELGGSFIHQGFGSSDCRSGCRSHLLRISHKSLDEASKIAVTAFTNAGLRPHIILVRNVFNASSVAGKGFSETALLSLQQRNQDA